MERKQTENSPEQSYDIFLSYKRADIAEAMLLKSAIQSLGYSVFFDQDALHGENDWRKAISQNIARSRGLVFFRTVSSVTSKYCQAEVISAEDMEKTILPVAAKNQPLPFSDELRIILQPLQTTLISDFSNVSVIKNELQAALLKAFGKPSNPENALQIIEFMNSAAANLSSRFHVFLESLAGNPKIFADVTGTQISLKWNFMFAGIPVCIGISLNEFSKRSRCFGNCKNKDQCRMYNQKGIQEYSVEAFIDAMEYGRQTILETALVKILGIDSKYCKTQGFRYFFRKQILTGEKVNEANKFKAILVFLDEAVRFYDEKIAALREYFTFASEVCNVCLTPETVLEAVDLNGPGKWGHDPERRHKNTLHFHKQDSPPAEEKLGVLCSVAIKYPDALRIKLHEITDECITFRICRFYKDKQRSVLLKYHFSRWQQLHEKRAEEIREKMAESIRKVFSLPYEKYRFSTIPGAYHEQLADFISSNQEMDWTVEQTLVNSIVAAGCYKGFDKIRFTITLTWHLDSKMIDWQTGISSDSEENGEILSRITGYPVGSVSISASEDECKNRFAELKKKLDKIHDNVYEVYKAVFKIGDILTVLRKNNARSVLSLGSFGGKVSEINAYKNNETCWEYYLSSGTRLLRKLNGYPLSLSIRFASAGAGNASIGWCADGDFKKLSFLEKKIFWRYVLSQFPENMRNCFACRENAIFLADESSEQEEFEARQAKIFKTAVDVKEILNAWLSNDGGGTLMKQMCDTLCSCLEKFGISQ